MIRFNQTLTILLLIVLLVSACQPIIVPAASNADSAPVWVNLSLPGPVMG